MWQGAWQVGWDIPETHAALPAGGTRHRPSEEGARSLTPELQGRDEEGSECWQPQPLLWNLGGPHGGPRAQPWGQTMCPRAAKMV